MRKLLYGDRVRNRKTSKNKTGCFLIPLLAIKQLQNQVTQIIFLKSLLTVSDFKVMQMVLRYVLLIFLLPNHKRLNIHCHYTDHCSIFNQLMSCVTKTGCSDFGRLAVSSLNARLHQACLIECPHAKDSNRRRTSVCESVCLRLCCISAPD